MENLRGPSSIAGGPQKKNLQLQNAADVIF